ncbi:hypothetical protein [Haloplanus halophilus]|uniref:hypothetical protein n=1 Tax=Haloplanus halophilus TaxID=2949993 RepID=UPI002040F8CF|nr:hypothetical protein [Haloplanus sp. GDY1]
MSDDQTTDDLDTASESSNRSGMQALYSFTPFSLQNTSPYELLLTPVSYLRTDRWLKSEYRSQSVRDSYKVTKETFEKDVVHPHSLRTKTFREEDDASIEFKHHKYKQRSAWQYPPMYAEFSYEALNSGYSCQLGWVLTSSNKQECPMRQHCPDFTGGSRCDHYEGPFQYERLFKIYPGIVRGYQDPTSGNYDYVTSIRGDAESLAKLSFTTAGQVNAYINEITFDYKPSYMFGSPSLYTQEGIGFRMENVNAVQLSFGDESLHDMLLDLLEENEALRNWIALKYHLYVDLDYVDTIKPKGGFDAFEELRDAVEAGIRGGEDEERDEDTDLDALIEAVETVDFETDELAMEFAEITFIHTIAHALRDWLVNTYGCDHDHIEYYLEHPELELQDIPADSKRIVFFESAIGGFGYLDSLKRDLRDEDSETSFESILDSVHSFLDEHRSQVHESKSKATNKLAQYDTDDAERVGTGLETLEDINIFPHPKAIRQGIHQVNDLGNRSERERALLDDIFQHVPICWDGCTFCVDDDEDCSFLPFDRPFLISRDLAYRGTEYLLEKIREPETSGKSLPNDFYGILYDAFLEAESTVILVVPKIDLQVLEDVAKFAQDSRVQARFVTTEDAFETLDEYETSRVEDILADTSLVSLSKRSGPLDPQIVMDGIVSITGDLPFNYDRTSVDSSDLTIRHDHQEITEELEGIGISVNND